MTDGKDSGTPVATKPVEQDKRPKILILEENLNALLKMVEEQAEELKQVKEVINGMGTEIEALRTAKEASGNGTVTADQIVAALFTKMGAVATAPKVSKAKFGGHTGAKKTLDTKTNITYDSESKCAKAVAKEFGLDPDDHFAWYKIPPETRNARFKVVG